MGFLGGPNENDECYMDPPVPTDRTREPWNCSNCGKMIYNLDKKGHPAPGAPLPKVGNLCSLCFDMKLALEQRPGMYWSNLHNEWLKRQKSNDKLKSDGDYFSK